MFRPREFIIRLPSENYKKNIQVALAGNEISHLAQYIHNFFLFNKFKFLNVDKNMSCIKTSAVLQVALFSEDCGGGHVCWVPCGIFLHTQCSMVTRFWPFEQPISYSHRRLFVSQKFSRLSKI